MQLIQTAMSLFCPFPSVNGSGLSTCLHPQSAVSTDAKARVVVAFFSDSEPDDDDDGSGSDTTKTSESSGPDLGDPDDDADADGFADIVPTRYFHLSFFI